MRRGIIVWPLLPQKSAFSRSCPREMALPHTEVIDFQGLTMVSDLLLPDCPQLYGM